MLLKYSTLVHIQGSEGALKYTQENKLPLILSGNVQQGLTLFSPNNLLTLEK